MDEQAAPGSPAPSPGLVPARRAEGESLRTLRFRERVLESLWFVPSAMALGSVAVAVVALETDRAVHSVAPDWFPAADVGSAALLTGTVAAASLTFVVTLFTTTLIAIQLASGQYSPRVVRIFVHARFTHVTLGLFLSAFLVDVVALAAIRSTGRQFVPALTVTLAFAMLLCALGAFVAFLHRMTQLLRVQYVMLTVVDQGAASLAAAFPIAEVYVDAPAPAPAEQPAAVRLPAGAAGVIQAIDRKALIDQAVASGGWIELLVQTGQYVGAGTPVARFHGGSPRGAADLSATFLLGSERTFTDDPGFAIRMLADIGVRALSPGVNDPTTASQAIDRITDLVCRVGDRPDPPGWYIDGAGSVRLLAPQPGLGRLLTLAFIEIIRWGSDSPQVVRRLHEAFDELHATLRPDLQPELAALEETLAQAVRDVMPAALVNPSALGDVRGLG